jgi:antagonist of KipI
MTSLVSDGREGFRSLGIGPGGAMDFFAMKTANYLVGNDTEAVIEIGHSPAEVLFQSDCLISTTGRGFEAYLNNELIPLWKPIKIKESSILKLKKNAGGAWAYLSVAGGWKAQEWLGSTTTNLNAKSGGFYGRILQKEDVIESNGSKIQFSETKILPWGISVNELNKVYSPSNILRCIPSVEADLLSSASKKKIESGEFILTSQSNRMGYRLKGEPLSLNEKTELISSPVDFGTIQLLPDGNLIVLMADHQTTGGYPRIASVIKADLAKLAQLLPGDKIKFKMVSLTEAESELSSRQLKLNELKESCHLKLKSYLNQ